MDSNSKNVKSVLDYSIIRHKSKIQIHDVELYRSVECGRDKKLLKVIYQQNLVQNIKNLLAR